MDPQMLAKTPPFRPFQEYQFDTRVIKSKLTRQSPVILIIFSIFFQKSNKRSKFSFAWPPRTGARKPSSVVKPPATPPHTNNVQKYFFRRRHNTQLPKFISAAIAPLESALHLCIQRLDRVGERRQTFFAMQSRRKTIEFWRR